MSTIKRLRCGTDPGPCENCPACGRAMVWDRPAGKGRREWVCPCCMSDHQMILELAIDMLVRKAAEAIPDLKPGRQVDEAAYELKTTVLEIAARRAGLPVPALTPFRRD